MKSSLIKTLSNDVGVKLTLSSAQMFGGYQQDVCLWTTDRFLTITKQTEPLSWSLPRMLSVLSSV